jgi:hypothetical protein
MAQLCLPCWNLLQEVCNELRCNEILQLYLQNQNPVNFLSCTLGSIYNKEIKLSTSGRYLYMVSLLIQREWYIHVWGVQTWKQKTNNAGILT